MVSKCRDFDTWIGLDWRLLNRIKGVVGVDFSTGKSIIRHMTAYGALNSIDADSAIERIAAGTLSKVIAEEIGCTPRGLRYRLAKHPDYEQAVKEQAESLVEIATSKMFDDSLKTEDVPIARARVDAAHKWAAARDPARWAPKGNQINVQINNVTVDQGLTDSASSLLAALRLPETEQITDHPLL